jgi:hypothetical protein
MRLLRLLISRKFLRRLLPGFLILFYSYAFANEIITRQLGMQLPKRPPAGWFELAGMIVLAVFIIVFSIILVLDMDRDAAIWVAKRLQKKQKVNLAELRAEAKKVDHPSLN